MPELRLYHLPGACSRVSLAALMLIGVPFEVVMPQPAKGGIPDPALSALNPQGQVPTLLIDGRPLAENVAILVALAKLYPAAGLLPLGDPEAEARAISRMVTCASQLHPQIGRIAFPSRFCDLSAESEARVREQAVATVMMKLSAVEPSLEGKTWWLGGDKYSIADLYLGWITSRVVGLGVDLSSLPHITAHLRRTHALPITQDLLERERGYCAALEAEGRIFPPKLRAAMIG